MTEKASRIDRVLARVAPMHEWLVPPATGALVVILFIATPAGLLSLVMYVTIVLLGAEDPVASLMGGAAAVAAAIVGGILAGTIYSLVGRFVARIPHIGPYIAGILTISPYFAALMFGIRALNERPLLRPIEDAEVLATIICSVIFGSAFGHAAASEASGEEHG